MIDEFSIQNFKCFADRAFHLHPLTVLTGKNSAGKSSFMQALSLMFQARSNPDKVALTNVGGVDLGEGSDVLFEGAESPQITLAASRESNIWTLKLAVPDSRSLSLDIVEESGQNTFPEALPSNGGFTYLSAERTGPRDVQEVAPIAFHDVNVGSRGEYCAHVLTALDREVVLAERRHPETESRGGVITFPSQVEAWMSSIVTPVQIRATWLPGTAATTLRFKPPEVFTEWLRPANVGFGISYSLPIVIAGLSSPPGGLLIVENPEAHLHPAGQSAIGKFLAIVAASGTQVIIETHSDHVLNGIRLQALPGGSLDASQLVVHYFGKPGDPIELTLNERADLSEWPAGFFDQTESDLSQLLQGRHG